MARTGMARRRNFWIVYALAGLAALTTFAIIGFRIDRLENDRDRVRTLSTHRDRLRLAVWRMDAWLNALLAPEAARPPTDYDSPSLQGLRAAVGDYGAPALAGFRSEWFQLHFSMAGNGRLVSPQLVADTASAETRRIASSLGDASALWNRLESLRPFLDQDEVELAFAEANDQVTNRLDAGFGALGLPPLFNAVTLPETIVPIDLRTRIQQSIQTRSQPENQLAFQNFGPGGLRVGPLVPLWLEHGGEQTLAYLRQVEWNNRQVLQGFAVDWPKLRSALLLQIEDLFDAQSADLRPASEIQESGLLSTLATAPLALAVSEPTILAKPWSSTRTVLVTAFGALLTGFLAIGWTMKNALDLGHRQSQFASAVTHELRSPLTTFRMYAEMLDEGMVRGEEKRKQYLRTLRDESDRLAHLVESVLVQARIERGREQRSLIKLETSALFERILPGLRRICENAERPLLERIDATTQPLETDPEAIEQILTCLVDNACRHAIPTSDPALELHAQVEANRLVLRLRDHGPGIPSDRARAIFRTFERGAKQPRKDQNQLPDPGLGLGLSIARGLAKSLGATLELESEVTDGASFALRIPI